MKREIDFDSLFSGRSPKAKAVVDSTSPSLNVRSFAEYGEFQLVGHGEITSEFCGAFLGFKGCNRVEKHNVVTLDGKDYRGKVYVRRIRKWCNKPTCPVCYRRGWANREAGNITERLTVASKRFGQVEHIVASVPPEKYGLPFEKLRAKVYKVLKSRGVMGGAVIFHGFRYNPYERYWYWSPHFHVLGFIDGGFGRCRRCKKKGRYRCYSCSGFKGRQVRGYDKDRWIVKCLGKRITVYGTAWYQLHHASVKKGVKRFHVATWFGIVSYRKMKVERQKREEVCPLCGDDLLPLRYVGNKTLEMEARDSWEDYMEDGRVVWVEDVSEKKRGSGSYEDY